jgi:RNA polymerase sigma-70 factor, ECF subfamily
VETSDPDEQLVQRVVAGDLPAFELLMRRHNQKLYRVVRSVLRDNAEVEDAMQEAYLAAFRHLGQFQGRARFGTWLLKIGINEALARLRRRMDFADRVDVDELADEEDVSMTPGNPVPSPEEQAANHQLVTIIEAALDHLPLEYRQVLVLRLVESLDTSEAAEVLGLSESAVKQRLHRGRAMLQEQMERQVGSAVQGVFGFLGERCDRVVAGVMHRLAENALNV